MSPSKTELLRKQRKQVQPIARISSLMDDEEPTVDKPHPGWVKRGNQWMRTIACDETLVQEIQAIKAQYPGSKLNTVIRSMLRHAAEDFATQTWQPAVKEVKAIEE